MAAIETARQLTRIGQRITLIGGSVGLLVWVLVYLGIFLRPIVLPAIVCIWPIGLGAAVMGLGLILEKSAKSA